MPGNGRGTQRNGFLAAAEDIEAFAQVPHRDMVVRIKLNGMPKADYGLLVPPRELQFDPQRGMRRLKRGSIEITRWNSAIASGCLARAARWPKQYKALVSEGF